ncbi:MAG: GNAT family N-acetyltransferase [Myxococcales bacterium]|nr:GNAT family N-acetyltransferase [Myxococcales bacterium]
METEPDGLLTHVGINVGPKSRGQGVGKIAIALVCDLAKSLGLRHLNADIKPANQASERIFKANGFEFVREHTINGVPANQFRRTI